MTARSTSLTAALIAAVLLWIALPWMVIAIDDDFSYLRSVVQTIQKGRPWTDEWLTPWAASSSLLAALLYQLTQSFTFAIHGSLLIAAAALAGGLAYYWKQRGFSSLHSIGLTLGLLLCPTIFFMNLMYTAVPLYWACGWWAIIFAGQRRWWAFLLVFLFALMCRQSAIVWLALPGCFFLTEGWRAKTWFPPRLSAWAPLIVIGLGLIALVLLLKNMNPTVGRQATFAIMRESFGFGHFRLAGVIGLSVFGAGVGFSSLITAIRDTHLGRTRRHLSLTIIGAVLGALLGRWIIGQLHQTHGCYSDSWSTLYALVIGAGAGAGLSVVRRPWRLEALVAALGCWMLVVLYGGGFDYYFVELFFWGCVATAPTTQPQGPPPDPIPLAQSSWARWTSIGLGWSMVAFFLLYHGRWFFRLKMEQDRHAGLITTCEKALRSGQITTKQLGGAPFGYVGWQLETAARRLPYDGPYQLTRFVYFVDAWDGQAGTGTETQFPKNWHKRFRAWLPAHNTGKLSRHPQVKTLAQSEARLLWFFTATYRLLEVPRTGPDPSGRLPHDPKTMPHLPFPLNDAEWRQHISAHSQ